MSALTTRERLIARLVASARTNREIAEELGIAERTVQWNLTRVFRKLGVRSRTELAVCVAGTAWAEEPIAEGDNPGKTGRSEDEGGS